jgi:hypothetical protein
MAEESVNQIARAVPANPDDLNDGYDDGMEIAEIAKPKENLNRSFNDTQTEFDCDSSTQRVATSDEVAGASARAMRTSRLIEKLGSLQVVDRLAFQVAPAAKELPYRRLAGVEGLSVSPKPSNVGGFGSVFNTGSHLHRSGGKVDHYLRLAGGRRLVSEEVHKRSLVQSAKERSQILFQAGLKIAEIKGAAR